MARYEADHRRELEHKKLALQTEKLRREDRIDTRAQWLSFILGMAAIGGAIYATSHGQGGGWNVLAAGGIGGAFGGFLTSRVNSRRRKLDGEPQ